MSINKSIYNLCAGMIQDGESVEECARRELYEETGLSVPASWIFCRLPYSAGFSDTSTYLCDQQTEGSFPTIPQKMRRSKPDFIQRKSGKC